MTTADLRELRALALALLKEIDKLEAQSAGTVRPVDLEPSPEAYARMAALRRRHGR